MFHCLEINSTDGSPFGLKLAGPSKFSVSAVANHVTWSSPAPFASINSTCQRFSFHFKAGLLVSNIDTGHCCFFHLAMNLLNGVGSPDG